MRQLKKNTKGSPELRKRLPYGSIKMLSQKHSFSWAWIYKVVSGQANGDPKIISDALRLAEIQEHTEAKLKEIIEKKRKK